MLPAAHFKNIFSKKLLAKKIMPQKSPQDKK